jgi:hypothetical protein
MFGWIRRESLRGAQACESCGQICTQSCRANAYRERARSVRWYPTRLA